MAKKKHRPNSPTANRQRSVVRQEETAPNVSSSSVAERQKGFITTQKTSDPSLAEEHQIDNVTSKQVKSSSSSPLAASAAERRRKRVASQRTSSTARAAPSAGEKRRRAVRKSWWQRNSFALIGGILLVVVIVVGIFIVIGNSPSKGKTGPTDPDILKKVTTIKQTEFADVKTGGVQNVLQPPAGSPPLLTGPSGKPEVFFYGAEFCPFCGAERWSVTVALSRFGTFTQLPLIVSSEDSIPTFTFHGSKYSSNYIDFVPLELEDGARQPLETASAAQQQLLNRYDVKGFPFIDIGDKYIAAKSIFEPALLKGLSQQEIANMLSDPTRDVTQKIVGAANYLTAAICVATDNKPEDVCKGDPIPGIRNSLPTSPVASLSSAWPLSVAMQNCPGELATCRRRGDILF